VQEGNGGRSRSCWPARLGSRYRGTGRGAEPGRARPRVGPVRHRACHSRDARVRPGRSRVGQDVAWWSGRSGLGVLTNTAGASPRPRWCALAGWPASAGTSWVKLAASRRAGTLLPDGLEPARGSRALVAGRLTVLRTRPTIGCWPAVEAGGLRGGHDAGLPMGRPRDQEPHKHRADGRGRPESVVIERIGTAQRRTRASRWSWAALPPSCWRRR